MIDAGPRHDGNRSERVANDDKSGPEDVEGSWSPKRPRSSSSKSGAAKGGSPDPEVLAQEIEQTREELAETLDAIADKVSPKKVVGRTKKAAKDGVADAVEAVKGTAASAADSAKGGVAAVKEKVSGDSAPAAPATSVAVGSASPLSDDTVSIPAAEVPVEPAPTPGALADAAFTVTEPAGGETPYVSTLPPPAPSRVPVVAGAGALLVLLYVLTRRRR